MDTPKKGEAKDDHARNDDVEKGDDAKDDHAKDNHVKKSHDVKGHDVKKDDDAKNSKAKKGSKRKSEAERLAALKEKKEQLNAQIDTILKAARARDRKGAKRRKILAGSVALTFAEESEEFRKILAERLDETLKSDRDRELFKDLLK